MTKHRETVTGFALTAADPATAQPATPGEALQLAVDCLNRFAEQVTDEWRRSNARAAAALLLGTAPAQPEPGLALRIAAAKLANSTVWADPFGEWHAGQAQAAGAQKQLMVDRLNDLAGELDAAPAAPRTVLAEVAEERQRQDAKWGEQNHPDGTGPEEIWELTGPAAMVAASARAECKHNFAAGSGTWLDILLEEVAEAFAEAAPADLRTELVQVAAVAVAWVEAIDRRGPLSSVPPAGTEGDRG